VILGLSELIHSTTDDGINSRGIEEVGNTVGSLRIVSSRSQRGNDSLAVRVQHQSGKRNQIVDNTEGSSGERSRN